MFIYLKKLRGIKVYIKKQKNNIGYINDTVLDKNKKQIIGFIINKKGIIPFKKAVLIDSIISLDKDKLIIKRNNSLVKPKNIFNKDSLSLNKLEHLRIISKSGDDYGYLEDFYANYKFEIVKAEATQGIIGDIMKGRKIIPVLGDVELSEEFIVLDNESVEESIQNGGLSSIFYDRR